MSNQRPSGTLGEEKEEEEDKWAVNGGSVFFGKNSEEHVFWFLFVGGYFLF